MLVKVIGLLALIFLLNRGMKLGEKQLTYIMNFTQITLTQSEVNNITQVIYTDIIIFNDYQLPRRSGSWWSDYIRENLHSDAPGRNTSKDFWMTPFQVKHVDKIPGRKGDGFMVCSAGPDKKYETDDDIIAQRSFN